MFTRNIGLNSRSFSSVSRLKYGPFYFRGCTRILQKDRICGPHGREKKFSALAGGQLPILGLQKEPMRHVSDQAALHDHQPDGSLIRVILPVHQRPNGTVRGSVMVEDIIQTATITANRYCNQQINTIGDGSRRAVLCSLSSFDELNFLWPLRKTGAIFVNGSVTATSDHLLLVEVALEAGDMIESGDVKLMNFARLSFVAHSHHDLSQREHVIPLKSHTGGSGDSHQFRLIPPKEKDSGHTISDPSELIHPEASSVTLIHPHHLLPPPQLFCRPGHLCKLMEEHGIIAASRLTHHDVVTVHMSNVRFRENVKPESAVVVSGEVASMAGDVLTMFLTVDAFFSGGTKPQKCRAAEGHFSYVPINSAKERVSLPCRQVLSTYGPHESQDHKEIGIDYNVVGSYVNALKKIKE